MEKKEQDSILTKAADALGTKAVLLNNPDTISYFTGMEFPFAEHFPERPLTCIWYFNAGLITSALICPYEWSRAAADQGWKGEIMAYTDGERNPIKYTADAVAQIVKKGSLSSESISVEADVLPYPLYNMLKEMLPSVRWLEADEKIEQLRMIKTRADADLLQTAAEQLEFGLIGAVQHLEGSLEEIGYTLPEFCERIRVHIYETGGTAGGFAAAAAGTGLQQWYSRPEGVFKEGDLVRVEATSRYLGYWANTSRMMVIGDALDSQKRAYDENLHLKKKALSMLKPGVKCPELFSEIAAEATAKGIDFRGEFGIGHGIGFSEREAPYLGLSDSTVLKSGMCIVLAVYTEGPRKELICVKDTYYLDSGKAVCLSSYHNWDVLYEVNGFRSAH